MKKKIAFSLLALNAASAWASLPSRNAVLTDPRAIAQVLGRAHEELRDLDCVSRISDNPQFKAYVAVGYRLSSLRISRLFDASVSQNYVRLDFDFGGPELHSSCALK